MLTWRCRAIWPPSEFRIHSLVEAVHHPRPCRSKGYAEKNPRTRGCFILIRSHWPPPLPQPSQKGNKSRVYRSNTAIYTLRQRLRVETLPPAFALQSSSQNHPPAGLSTRPRQVKWYCSCISIYSVLFGIKACNHSPQGYTHHNEANHGPQLLSRTLHLRKSDYPWFPVQPWSDYACDEVVLLVLVKFLLKK